MIKRINRNAYLTVMDGRPHRRDNDLNLVHHEYIRSAQLELVEEDGQVEICLYGPRQHQPVLLVKFTLPADALKEAIEESLSF